MTALPFDGSHLGAYEFGDVIHWAFPYVPGTSGHKVVPFKAIMKLRHPDGKIQHYPVILKRNTSGRSDQAVVDEMKPLFGLQKMGTHRIRLHGIYQKVHKDLPWLLLGADGKEIANAQFVQQWSEYYIFRASTGRRKGSTGTKISFHYFIPLNEAMYYPFLKEDVTEEHKRIYQEIQKIYVFRDLFRVSSSNGRDVLIRFHPSSSEQFKALFYRNSPLQRREHVDPHDNIPKCNLLPITCRPSDEQNRLIPLSIDEMKVKPPGEHYKGLADDVKNYCLQGTDIHAKALIKMLGLTEETYPQQIELLRNSMSRIISRVDEEKLWLVDSVISQIADRVRLYYNFIASEGGWDD